MSEIVRTSRSGQFDPLRVVAARVELSVAVGGQLLSAVVLSGCVRSQWSWEMLVGVCVPRCVNLVRKGMLA